MEEKIYIAKIGKVVGLKGYLRLHIDSDFTKQFSKDYVVKTNKNITLTIEDFNPKTNLIKFINYDTSEDATKLINSQLFTTMEDTRQNCKLEKNQYFWFDLIGCQIIENDNILGAVIQVQRYLIDDYFEIETSQELLKNNDDLSKVFLLPYINKYILNVDIDKKIILTSGALEILEAS